MREKLTDRSVKTLGPGLYWDTHPDAPDGFILQVTNGGARAYRLNYRRLADGRERRMTIGNVAAWPIAEARKRAAHLRRQVDAGGDPLTEKEELRAAPSVGDLVARYLKEELPRLAPSTQFSYRSMIERRILPAFGERKVSSITRDDVVRLHRAISDEPREISGDGKKRAANATKGMLSVLFGKAVEWGLREDNPARLVKAHAEHGRERFLSEEEFTRLFEQLDTWQSKYPEACDVIRLAVLTGGRRGEILGATWDQFDLAAGVWTKPPATTKQRRRHRVPLSAETIELLRCRLAAREGPRAVVRLSPDDHVFEGGNTKAHSNRFEYEWRQIRAAAGLADCRFHDLRHSYASVLVGKGLSLPIIGAMLGHSKPQTTQRYAHLADAPLREAAAIVGRIVGGKGPAK